MGNFLTLKPYANITQNPVLFYQIIEIPLMSPAGIEPATDVLCHNISVALPTLLSTMVVVIIKTESCIRKPKIRNQLLFHAFYLSDDRVRLKFCESTSDRDLLFIPIKEYTPTVNMPYYASYCQQSTESSSAEKTKCSEILKILY